MTGHFQLGPFSLPGISFAVWNRIEIGLKRVISWLSLVFFQSSPIEQNNFDNPLEKTAERSLILSIFRHGKYDFLIYFICILENSNNSIFRHLQGSPDGSIARLYRSKCIIPFREIFKNFARTRVQLCAAWVLRCVRGSLSTGVYRIKL